MQQPLILASTSRYRRELLNRLGLPCSAEAPGVEETPHPAETPRAMVERLARAKAAAVAARHPGAWVIGSDQVAVLGDTVLGKPLTEARYREQLQACSGHEVQFLTAVSLCCSERGIERLHVDETVVTFRVLEAAQIARYVAIERPLDCAGGFKCEGLGIRLFERIDSSDPTALIGLPMIWLAGALADSAGLDPLA